jgi:hypothetical protein
MARRVANTMQSQISLAGLRRPPLSLCAKEPVMRLWLLPPLAFCLCLLSAAPAFAQADARAVLDKAIKAHGGEDKLTSFQAGRIKTKGKLVGVGGLEFTQDAAFQMPDKFHDELTLDVNGKQIKIVTIMNGTKVALTADGKKVPVTDAIKEALKDATVLLRVHQLVPLKAKGFELSSLGEAKVGDKTAVGIRVSRKGERDANLFFDKETGLLTKLERQTVDAMSGQEFTEERLFLDYKKADGLAMPGRMIINRDGKLYAEIEVTEAQHLKSIDDSEFNVE